ncbi:hypothetical protein ZYGR_0AK07720 [Zygosaccharomyces rouxii]|uniref:Aminotransferase class V domain-containing protein n=1 Tax=Zygosaccharomyces rouxii TaxID=4956 RepID=A0A1Q3AES5_ZYGRO|nr:hypothetical protein ZYGR_0AK07720 [Zygosaccharomyces rouxii]
MAVFGHEFRKKYFPSIGEDIVPVNHGSFGVTPSPVIEHQKQVIDEEERSTDEFYFFTCHEEYLKQVKILGSYLGIDYRNIALVTNATTAVNSVLRSIPWDFSKDRILMHSTTYRACANTIRFLADYFKLQYDIVELNYPLEDEKVLAAFEEKLSAGKYKLCLFDMISSLPGVKLPYIELISLCQKYNVWSLVDGAHAAGQVDLSFLDRLKPDFMTTNLHKWLFVPKSCAILYVNPKHHDLIQTFPVSWSYGTTAIESPETVDDNQHNENLLINKFSFVGTVTYSQMLSVSEALKFRSEVCGGEENIRKYQYDVQEKAIEKVKKVFGPGSKLLQNSTKTLTPPGLFNISLPVDVKYEPVIHHLLNDFSDYKLFKNECDKKMLTENKAFALFVIHNNEIWVRFSVNLYNEADDYVIGAASVKSVLEHFLDAKLENLKLKL